MSRPPRSGLPLRTMANGPLTTDLAFVYTVNTRRRPTSTNVTSARRLVIGRGVSVDVQLPPLAERRAVQYPLPHVFLSRHRVDATAHPLTADLSHTLPELRHPGFLSGRLLLPGSVCGIPRSSLC